MDKPDASPWPHGSEAPVVIALTDDERLHPMDAFADDLAQPQFIQIEAVRQSQLQIEKTVIDAFDADSRIPAQY